MSFEILECVVLNKDLPESHLRRGDIGTVVEKYDPDGVEVEFVTPTGKTRAVVTLTTSDIRSVSEDDMLAVRSLSD